ncbi:hypothetical protein FC16_GL001135 [Loigolactobacillus coryniformis subsp. torquens DSM 20004 = KCTC 3535]|uniref:Uncharacterized protein n=1 Tax=Loigolactobacillus coryniformis subsp. torquens DSM 20004 = KCTC 3535 TaxID=1423822 RepID=A0A2D1KPL6_9LACO|nr:hypothetical protein [Loigolactobacillus coryniformis]ATO44088.1 hypothetical protein LC20004_09220 [Loigolactobacillus coryniformis subsp. torquens DSM 20004 = KCTC 3535]KRK84565.1 hypothetical protein FC16_GL001135 [Loigolactobacillus coryniformis subsp. torquens DSM 20004 = KCTC 3535]
MQSLILLAINTRSVRPAQRFKRSLNLIGSLFILCCLVQLVADCFFIDALSTGLSLLTLVLLLLRHDTHHTTATK